MFNKICPKCSGELFMYEHYDEYHGDELKQEQHWECGTCHRYTTAVIVWYGVLCREELPDED